MKLLYILLITFSFCYSERTNNEFNWYNCEVKSIRIESEKQVRVKIFSYKNSQERVFFYSTDKKCWPENSTTEMKILTSTLLSAFQNKTKFNINFHWNSWQFGTYHINWIEFLKP